MICNREAATPGKTAPENAYAIHASLPPCALMSIPVRTSTPPVTRNGSIAAHHAIGEFITMNTAIRTLANAEMAANKINNQTDSWTNSAIPVIITAAMLEIAAFAMSVMTTITLQTVLVSPWTLVDPTSGGTPKDEPESEGAMYGLFDNRTISHTE